MMKKVTGGIFFKTQEKAKSLEWYKNHLGTNSEDRETSFHWREKENSEKEGYTVWSPFKDSTDYFKLAISHSWSIIVLMTWRHCLFN